MIRLTVWFGFEHRQSHVRLQETAFVLLAAQVLNELKYVIMMTGLL